MGNCYRGAFRGKMRGSDDHSPLAWPTIAGLFYLWRRDLVANMLAHSSGIVVAMFTMVPPPVPVWPGQFQ